MSAIDATARIAAGAVLGNDVTVGPYCIVGPNVVIADGCRLQAHVHVGGHTSIGAGTMIAPFASLGGPPQSVKYRGGPTRLTIGAGCDIREYVTVNVGTEDGGDETIVGARCFLMAGSHVAHDCKIGDDVVFANNVLLAGHVVVGARTVFGGQAAVRQFVHIGECAMIVGLSGVRADVIPFGLARGRVAALVGLNVVGMRRAGLSKTDIQRARGAYEGMFFGEGTFRDRVRKVAADYADDPVVGKILAFIEAPGTERPLTMAVRRNTIDEGE